MREKFIQSAVPGPRFFLSQPLTVGAVVAFEKNPFAHAIQVLRLRQGARMVLFNGAGGEYHAVLEKLEKKIAYARIESFCADERAAAVQITLVQVISKSSHMDYAVQKATELGVDRIVPVFSDRSVPKSEDQRMQKRLQHWRAIIASACEQCGRNRLPGLQAALHFREWLRQGDKNGIILDPRAVAKLGSLADKANSLCVIVGAEGGFSDEEMLLADRAGLTRVQMGPRIMRTETAAVAALAAIHALWGDFT